MNKNDDIFLQARLKGKVYEQYIKELVERATPKKVVPKLGRGTTIVYCPHCHHTVDNHFCCECGQKLDWYKNWSETDG